MLLAAACTTKSSTGAQHSTEAATPSSAATSTRAAESDLDPSFGSGGEVTTSLTEEKDEIHAVVFQADGKIVAAGSAGSDAEFALARYDLDGTLDSTFGDGGTVTTNFTSENDVATGVAIQPDAKIVAAGYAGQAGSASNGKSAPDFALARYNPDGTLDTTFGDEGKVTTSFTSESDFALGIAIQADGKIVAAGGAGDGGSDENFGLARYNPDGSLDTTFGKGGKVNTDFAGRDGAHAVAIQANGKIVAAGVTFAPKSVGGAVSSALARYDLDGTLDTTFGKAGETVTDLAGVPFRVAIQADGMILASGGDFNGTPKFTLARYEANGRLDDAFGAHGTVTSKLLDPFAGIAIQSDGKIVAAGSSFTLVRFNADGTLDTTFGTDGEITTDFGPGFSSTGSGAVAIQADGNILAAGSASVSKTDSDFALARYLAT